MKTKILKFLLIYGVNNQADKEQYDLAIRSKIKFSTIPISSNVHCGGLSGKTIIKIICSNKKSLNKLYHCNSIASERYINDICGTLFEKFLTKLLKINLRGILI